MAHREFYVEASKDDAGRWVAFLGEEGKPTIMGTFEGFEPPTTKAGSMRLSEAAEEYLRAEGIRNFGIMVRIKNPRGKTKKRGKKKSTKRKTKNPTVGQLVARALK